MKARYIMVCPHCGSDNIAKDAAARWCTVTQKWEVTNVMDSGNCDDCDSEINYHNVACLTDDDEIIRVDELTPVQVDARRAELENSLNESLDDDKRAAILDEIAACESWLEKQGAQ